MNDEKRDELLVRIDERVCQLREEDVPEIKEHLKTLNGKVNGNKIRSKVNQAMIAVSIIGGGSVVTKIMELW